MLWRELRAQRLDCDAPHNPGLNNFLAPSTFLETPFWDPVSSSTLPQFFPHVPPVGLRSFPPAPLTSYD